jgi:hypothetical protein
MAEQSTTGRLEGSKSSQEKTEPICGIIMPISTTANRSESHWADMQKILHRAISQAGFDVRNVWESSSTDRISERIVGNIFNFPIVVADISDQNPNVMLELGLRLSSKKPTVVVAQLGEAIPFDIRDFQALFYPADMNMLGMEDFFRKLVKSLNDKMAASKGNTYTPFLNSVIIDVASPETRELGANDLLLSRLDDISRRLLTIEMNSSRGVPAEREASRPWGAPISAGILGIKVPQDNLTELRSHLGGLYEVDGFEDLPPEDGESRIIVRYSGSLPTHVMERKVLDAASMFGGEETPPF